MQRSSKPTLPSLQSLNLPPINGQSVGAQWQQCYEVGQQRKGQRNVTTIYPTPSDDEQHESQRASPLAQFGESNNDI